MTTSACCSGCCGRRSITSSVGDVRAKRTLSELRDRADAVGCRSIGYVVSAIDVMQLIRDGRLDEAERAAHECFEHGVDVGDADATGYYGAHLLTIRFMQDRDSELLDLARDISSASILIKPEFGYRARVRRRSPREPACTTRRPRCWPRSAGTGSPPYLDRARG